MLKCTGRHWGDSEGYSHHHSPLGHPQYGMQLYRNYQQAQARLSQHPWITPTPLVSAPHPLRCSPDPWGAPHSPQLAVTVPTAERVRQRAGGHGLLGVHGEGD